MTSESKADGYWGKSKEEMEEVYEGKLAGQENGRVCVIYFPGLYYSYLLNHRDTFALEILVS